MTEEDQTGWERTSKFEISKHMIASSIYDIQMHEVYIVCNIYINGNNSARHFETWFMKKMKSSN